MTKELLVQLIVVSGWYWGDITRRHNHCCTWMQARHHSESWWSAR